MALTQEDIEAIGKLLDVRLDEKLSPLQQQIEERFNLVAEQIEGLYHHDEKREQEYQAILGQIQRVDGRLEGIDTRLDRIEGKFDGHETRIASLEKKCA